jgi:hypothetical protein
VPTWLGQRPGCDSCEMDSRYPVQGVPLDAFFLCWGLRPIVLRQPTRPLLPVASTSGRLRRSTGRPEPIEFNLGGAATNGDSDSHSMWSSPPSSRMDPASTGTVPPCLSYQSQGWAQHRGIAIGLFEGNADKSLAVAWLGFAL